MTKTEYLEQICIALGIDVSVLPDRLLTTYLSAITEKLGVMKETGTLSEYLEILKGANDEAYEQGRKSQYDEFWDNYQNKGEGGGADHMFAGDGWKIETFKPKYDIVIAGQAIGMFNANRIGGDLVELLSNLGVRIDFTQSTNISNCFAWSEFTRIGEVRVNSTGVYAIFASCSKLVTIDKLIVRENITYDSWFYSCPALKNLTIAGTIGQNGFNVQWSTKLTHESLMSIINALEDKTADTSGTIWKVIIGSANMAKLTDEELRIVSQKGWDIE